MNKFFIIFSVALIVLMFVLQGCKKDEPDNTTPQYFLSFSRPALDYVKLTEGKYLIYKDSATANLDSVVITKSKLETILIPKGDANSFYRPAYSTERYNLTLTRYHAVGNTEWLSAYAGLLLDYPYASTDTGVVDLREPSNTILIVVSKSHQPHLSMEIEGTIYNDVAVTNTDTGVDISHPAYKKTTTYWAKGIGIIKREVITTGGAVKTYTLLRHN